MPLILTYSQHIKTIVEDEVLEKLNTKSQEINIRTSSRNNHTIITKKRQMKQSHHITSINNSKEQDFDNEVLQEIFQSSTPTIYNINIPNQSNKNVKNNLKNKFVTTEKLHLKLPPQNSSGIINITLKTAQNFTHNNKSIPKDKTTKIRLELEIEQQQDNNTQNQFPSTGMILINVIIPSSTTVHIITTKKELTKKKSTNQPISSNNERKSHLFLHIKSIINKNSTLYLTNVLENTTFLYLRNTPNLEEEHAEYQELTILKSKGQETSDIRTVAILNNRDTKAIIQFKGVLEHHSKCISRTNIIINKNAENSQGIEKSEIILVDEESKADCIPELEVHNDNTSCMHSGSITSLNEEKVFYLKSRGLSTEQAKELIITSFTSIEDHLAP